MNTVTNVTTQSVNREPEHYLCINGKVADEATIQDLLNRKPKKPARKVAYAQTRPGGFSLMK